MLVLFSVLSILMLKIGFKSLQKHQQQKISHGNFIKHEMHRHKQNLTQTHQDWSQAAGPHQPTVTVFRFSVFEPKMHLFFNQSKKKQHNINSSVNTEPVVS
jgi:hypothetical protein